MKKYHSARYSIIYSLNDKEPWKIVLCYSTKCRKAVTVNFKEVNKQSLKNVFPTIGILLIAAARKDSRMVIKK